MKEEILRQVNPVIEKAVDRVLEILETRKNDLNMRENRVTQAENMLKSKAENLTIKELEYKKQKDQAITDLENAKLEWRKQTQSLSEDQNKTKTLNAEIFDKQRKLDVQLAIANDARIEVEKIKSQVAKEKERYTLLLNNLAIDIENLTKEKQLIANEKEKVEFNKSDINNKYQQINDEKMKIETSRLELEVRKNRVEDLIKKNQLKSMLKKQEERNA